MTTAGTVRGAYQGGVAVFRGIPFAEAPFGKFRFQAPVPRAPWSGVRDALTFSPPAPQTDRALGAGPTLEGPSADPEPDCLTVNVWSPTLDGPLPVLVWVYGGGYLVGHGGQPVYDGTNLARDGVVVVTFNYRLGVDGFAALPGAPANRGLLDQVAALEWVRDNIAAFGGDPGNVTVFGESAGGGSIAALLAMPTARGLFRHAICQSVPATYFGTRLANDVTRRLASELGVAATAEGFARRTAAEAADAVAQLHSKMTGLVDTWGRVALTVTPFSPVVDGEVLPTSPWTALADGVAADVDVIFGWMHDEYRVFHVADGTLERNDPAEAVFVVDLLGPGEHSHADYRAAYPEKTEGELIEVAFSDWLFRMAGLRLARDHSSGGGRSYVYEVSLASPAEGGAWGACHGFDVPLTFGNFDNDGVASRHFGDRAPSAAVLRVSREIRDAWLDFARTGDPGWPVYEPHESPAKVFDETSAIVAPIEPVSAALWRHFWFDTVDLIT